MTYYLGKVGRAGFRLMSSCKDLYNDVNAAYLTGATDVVVVRQKDGSLKSTPFHVRFGKLGVLRTGDLKEVEIEVNGHLVDMTMNIDETGKVFYTRAREGSDEEHVIIDMAPGGLSGDEQESVVGEDLRAGSGVIPSSEPVPILHLHTDPAHADSLQSASTSSSQAPSSLPDSIPLPTPSVSSPIPPPAALSPAPSTSAPVPSLSIDPGPSTLPAEHLILPPTSLERRVLSVPGSPPGIGDPTMSGELMSCSLPSSLEVLSDTALETAVDRTDGEEKVRFTALSDTEYEMSERHSSRKHNSIRRKDFITKGEVSSQGAGSTSSDEEFKERLQQHNAGTQDRSGFWGTLGRILQRRHTRRYSTVEDGIYLEDIDYDSMDPEELSKFFPSSATQEKAMGPGGTVPSQLEPTTGSSGLGSSPTLSPAHSVGDIHKESGKENLAQLIATLDGVAFSLCGGLAQGTITEDTFQNSFVSFSDFCADPVGLLSNPQLVVRVAEKYYTWQVAAPLIMSAIVYLQVMPPKVQSKVKAKHMPKKSRQSFWNFWARGHKDEQEERAKSEGATPLGSPQKWTGAEGEGGEGKVSAVEELGALGKSEEGREKGEGLGDPIVGATTTGEDRLGGVVISTDEESEGGGRDIAKRPRQRSKRGKKIGFTNVLTSEQLESLNLKDGPNKVVFSITTKYQGTAKANCTVYLWNYTDKIVVSDIDGTITRSDVAGHVLPLLGMDWTQNGVVELFTAISKNGYNIIYLSARAIGQAGYTKEFLRKVRRGHHCLPDGPLFLFPFSLYKAFRKEVIERRPEEFKIMCLKQVRALFPEDYSPMHAGFGNRHNDVKSYMNVGIPESRIFTVNHKGILRHELSLTFQSSYSSLTNIVDRQFPPLRCRAPSFSHTSCPEEEDTKEEYNTFNYWRMPLEVELPFDLDVT